MRNATLSTQKNGRAGGAEKTYLARIGSRRFPNVVTFIATEQLIQTAMGHLTDDEILSHFQSGSPALQEAAFRQIYREYYGMVESLVVKNNGSPELAKDVFQDGLIVFFNKAKLGDLRLTSSLKTYLYSICRNLWLMQLRRSKREVAIEDAPAHVPIEMDFFQTLVVDEKQKIIVQLLEKMGEECQKILELFYYRHMNMVKIMEAFGLGSEQAAKNKKSQCLKKLRTAVMENNFYKKTLTN